MFEILDVPNLILTLLSFVEPSTGRSAASYAVVADDVSVEDLYRSAHECYAEEEDAELETPLAADRSSSQGRAMR
jgi:hypothetical protein